MSVLTLVHRALPFSLPWKRRQSASSKGKEKQQEVDQEHSELDSAESSLGIGHGIAWIPSAPLRCDVSHALHIAVKQSPDSMTSDFAATEVPEIDDSDLVSESQMHQSESDSDDNPSSSTVRIARAVSWASIVRSRCRWTRAQEQELVRAEKQLARCQKAWSSEQELWLAQIQVLSEEKEAHEGFMLMRMRQQQEEQSQFRKAWKRRRAVENSLQQQQQKKLSMMSESGADGLKRLRRLHRNGYLTPTPVLAVTRSPVLACQG